MDALDNLLDYDQPGELNIEVGARHSWVIEMKQYEDDAETIPQNWTGTHKIVIARDQDQDGDAIVYTIDETTIMVIAGNVMTIDFTTALPVIKAGKYRLDWRSDDGTGHSVHIAKGKAIFEHTQARP